MMRVVRHVGVMGGIAAVVAVWRGRGAGGRCLSRRLLVARMLRGKEGEMGREGKVGE